MGIFSKSRKKHDTLSDAVRAGDIRDVRRLLEEGIDPNEADPGDSAWPIHYAIHGGPDMVRVLINHGARVNVFSRGNTPLTLAQSLDLTGVADILREAGGTVDRSQWEFLKDPGEEHRGPSGVSCVDIAQEIRRTVSKFNAKEGMVILLLEQGNLQMYFFDGVYKTNWGYNDHQLEIDAKGRAAQVGLPMTYEMGFDASSLLPDTLQREFRNQDMSIGHLWQSHGGGWESEVFRLKHQNDVGIRISFSRDNML